VPLIRGLLSFPISPSIILHFYLFFVYFMISFNFFFFLFLFDYVSLFSQLTSMLPPHPVLHRLSCCLCCYPAPPWVDFTNILRAAFTRIDPKSAKNAVKSSVILGSMWKKALHKTLVKSTPLSSPLFYAVFFSMSRKLFEIFYSRDSKKKF